jgi:gas vesicle protein
MDNNTKSFFSGLLFGLTAGAVAGILLAPKSGKETREDIKKFAEDMGEKVSLKYQEVKAEVEKRLQELKAAGKKIDWDIYKDMVNEVLNELKQDGEVTADVAKRMGTQLGKDWGTVKTSLE